MSRFHRYLLLITATIFAMAMIGCGDEEPEEATGDQSPAEEIQTAAAGTFAASCSPGMSAGIVDIDTSTLIEVPDPLSGENTPVLLTDADVPAAGEGVSDPDLGTTQTRVVETEGLRHEYSRFDPFNADGSLIILHDIAEGGWTVYRTASLPYDAEGNLVGTVDLAEPRWDPADQDLIWGFRDFSIVVVNVETGQEALVKDFSSDPSISPILEENPDIYRITMVDEGESSLDMCQWALLLQGSDDEYRMRYLFTWDATTDSVPGVEAISAADVDIDWAGMSPLGNWVIIGGTEENGGRFDGLYIADRQLNEFHKLDRTTAHADVGLDSTGREVLVMQNTTGDTVDMIALDTAAQESDAGDGGAPGQTEMIRLFYDSESPQGFGSGIHVSCNAPGWCVVSTFIEPGVPEQNWLDRSNVLVKLDEGDPRVFYLSKVYGTTGAYWEETQAAISRDGRRVVWATNWDQYVGEERVWVLKQDLT